MNSKAKLSALSGRIFQTTLGILALIISVGLALYSLKGPMPAGTQQLGDIGEEPLRPVSCQFASVLSDLREALHQGSPAAQKYLREVTVQVAASGSFEELQVLVAQEQDPQVLEVLALAVVSRSHILQRIGDPVELSPLLER